MFSSDKSLSGRCMGRRISSWVCAESKGSAEGNGREPAGAPSSAPLRQLSFAKVNVVWRQSSVRRSLMAQLLPKDFVKAQGQPEVSPVGISTLTLNGPAMPRSSARLLVPYSLLLQAGQAAWCGGAERQGELPNRLRSISPTIIRCFGSNGDQSEVNPCPPAAAGCLTRRGGRVARMLVFG